VVESTIEVEFETPKGTVYTLDYNNLRPENQERVLEMLQETEDPDMDPVIPHEPFEDCG
jgi:hypothetical protein